MSYDVIHCVMSWDVVIRNGSRKRIDLFLHITGFDVFIKVHADLTEVYGEAYDSHRTAYRWVQRLKGEKLNIEVEHSPCCPVTNRNEQNFAQCVCV